MRLPYILIITHHWLCDVLPRTLFTTINGLNRMSVPDSVNFLKKTLIYLFHHHHLPPWIRSLDPFRHRRIAMVSWGAHDLFFLEVCSWGRVSEVWCCPFFQDGWSSFVWIWISHLVFQGSPECLHLFVVGEGGGFACLSDLMGYAGGNFCSW